MKLEIILSFILLVFVTQSCMKNLQKSYQNNFFSFFWSDNSIYGVYSRYAPMMPSAYVGSLFNEKYNQTFLFSMKFEGGYQLLAYIDFSFNNLKIQHIVQFQNEFDEIIQKEIIDIDYLNYEGNLVATQLQLNYDQNQLILCVQVNDFQTLKYFQKINLFPSQFEFKAGGWLNEYNLTYFPGDIYYLENCFSFGDYVLQLSNGRYPSCQFYDSFPDLEYKQYQTNQSLLLNPNQLIYLNYSINFWNKFEKSSRFIQNGIIQLISINQIQPKKGVINYGSDALRIELIIQDSEISTIQLYYYSYQFPLTKLNQELIASSIYKKAIGNIHNDLLTEWHHIEIIMQSKILQLNFIFPRSDKSIQYQSEKIYQFSYTQFTILIGSSNLQDFNGEIAEFSFNPCYSDGRFIQKCHFSCKSCFGPFFDNCMSCGQNSFRQFDSLLNTCHCRPFYAEINQQNCQQLPDYYQVSYNQISNQKGYEQFDPEIICSYGYFFYDDNCIQCPSANQNNQLVCEECLNGWKTWIFNPICSTDSNYQDIYVLYNLELIYCQDCFQICNQEKLDWNCYRYHYDHLNQSFYVKCSTADYSSCIFPQDQTVKQQSIQVEYLTQEYCTFYFNEQCLECKFSNQFILYDRRHCQDCLIKNCIHCYHYRIIGQYVSTLEFYQFYILFPEKKEFDDDFQIGCALCENGYFYNQALNECLLITDLYPDCLNYFIDANKNTVCLQTNLKDFSKGVEIVNCDFIISNCYSCVRISENRIICTKCYSDYYLTNFLTCVACPQNSLKCYYESELYLQKWVFQIQAFYVIQYNYTETFNFNWMQGRNEGKFYVICLDGYYYDGYTQCISYVKPNNCLQNNQQICYQCEESYNYQYKFQLYNHNCFQCSHQCQLCSSNFENCLLTDFTKYYISQTTRTVYPILDTCYRYKLQFTVNKSFDDEDYFGDNSFIIQLYQPQEIILNLKNTRANLQQNVLTIKYVQPNYLKSIQNTYINIFFTNQILFYCKIYEFEVVNIYNLYISLDKNYKEQIFSPTNPLILQAENGLILKFENLTISKNSRIERTNQNPIIIKNCKKLLIQNCLISNIITQNETLFQIYVEKDSIISLSNISFQNNNFIDVTMFSLVHQTINIFNITFFNCTFYNFLLFKITDSTNSEFKFGISLISIIDNEFNNFAILSENQFKETNVENFTISNSKIKDSQFIKSFSNLVISDLKFKNNSLQEFSIAFSNSSFGSLILTNFESITDQITNSLLFEINLMIETIIFENINFSETKIYNTIFQIQSYHLQIEYYSAQKFSGLHFLIQKSYNIIIRNINLRECFYEKNQLQINLESQIYENNFIIIQSFQKLNINDCYFDKIYTKDNPILAINSGQKGSIINIQNLSFSNCFLLQTNNIPKVSLLTIQTTQFSQIQIQRINCINTFVITKKFDQFGSQSSLFSIVSQQGKVSICNMILQNNYVSNSTVGMMYLEALTINLTKINNINTNIYGQQDLYFNDLIPKMNENQVFTKIYEITSLGGVFNIKSESVIMKNVESTNTTAAYGGFSYIQLNLQCSIQIMHAKIKNTQAIDQRSMGGSFYIECQSNNLDIQINHVDVENSTSVLNGGFFYLVPSAIKNKIQIINIKCKGVNSLASSFIDIKFETISAEHKVLIQNVFYQFSFYDFKLFSLSNNKISSQDYKLFTENNGFIVIQNGLVTLDNLYFYGDVLLQPIYYLVSILKLFIRNNQIYFIKQLSQYCLLFQSSDGQLESNLVLQNILIKQLNINTNFKESQISQEKETLFEQFISNLKPISSLMQFQQNTQIFKLKIFLIQIFNINQGVYKSSLVNIKIQNQENIKIEQVILIKNICAQNACISINNQNTSIQLNNNVFKNSYIISNEQQSYGSINFQKVNFQVKDSIFLHNAAKLQGGAIYYEQYKFSRIENSFFFNNTANQGGAVFSNQIIYDSVKKQNIFLQNFAQFKMNNYGQSYYNLQLAATSLNQKNKKLNEEGENSKIIIVNLPSGQMVKDYLIFQKSSQQFIKLDDFQFNLIVVNQLQEQQILEYNLECQVMSKLVNKNFELIQNQSNQRKIQVDSIQDIFNLANLEFIKNPYEQTYLEINVQCDFLQLPKYVYTFYINTYECKIGEYFYQDQCLQCNSEQGFYNLAPKTGDCQKIDTNIIKSNKNSLLELYPEYWRPNIFSDNITFCRNNPQNCIGGIVIGNDLCKIAHVGALCEECDLYNIRGAGKFSKNSNYTCSVCGNGAIIKFILISIWILFQINLAVKSTQQQNKTYLLYKISTKFYQILFRQQQDQSSSIFKLILNYFQIIQIIQTFQIKFQFSLAGVFNFIGNSSYSISYDFDCYLSQESAISIIYLNLIWMINLPVVYYLTYILMKLFLKNCDIGVFTKETFYSSQQYLIVSLKANIVSQLIQLMTPRKISGINWISRNVSFLYFNQTHILIILYGLIPLLLLFSLVIPSIYLAQLVQNKTKLTSYAFKQKYGYIYNEYKNQSYFWELIKLLKRELISFILVIFQENPVLKGIFLLLALQIYYIIFLKYNPYNLRRLNQFEHKFIILTIFTFLLSLGYQEFLVQSMTIISLSLIIQIIIQALLLMLILQSISQIFWIIRNYHHKIIERIISRFKCGDRYIQQRVQKSQRNQEILQQIRKLIKEGYLCSNKINKVQSIKTNIIFCKSSIALDTEEVHF